MPGARARVKRPKKDSCRRFERVWELASGESPKIKITEKRFRQSLTNFSLREKIPCRYKVRRLSEAVFLDLNPIQKGRLHGEHYWQVL